MLKIFVSPRVMMLPDAVAVRVGELPGMGVLDGVAVNTGVKVDVAEGTTVDVNVDVGINVPENVAVGVGVFSGVSVGAGEQLGGGFDGTTEPPTMDNISASVIRGIPRKSDIKALANTPLASVPKCPSVTRQL